jgi:acetyl esterase/lipase
MKTALAVLSLLAGLLGTPASASAETVMTGRAGQAFYRIVVPDAWNGQLVIWNHGFSLSPVGPVSDLGPLAPLQLAQGYAIAASSYRLSGWAVFKTNEDLEALYETFVERFGAPDQVIVTGASLGGIVTAAALEEARLGNVTGALSLCGALAGSRNWDAALDVRLAYDATCGAVPGAFLPGGAEGLPEGSTLTSTQMALAVHACFGILAPPPARTEPQRERLASFLALTQLPESFVLTVMGYATFAMSDLVHDDAKLKGRIGLGNENVVYGEPFDSLIARVTPHPGAAARMAESYTPAGAVGAAKIVSVHTDKDGLVIVENESEYASVVPEENLTVAVAVEAAPTHCGFSRAEIAASWEALRGWLAGAPQPGATAIQALCQALAPQFGGPCRIDPGFVIADMDGRIRPR